MITKVQLQDRGRYTCIASNSRSNVSTDVQLKVKGEMEICGIHREVNGSHEEERQKRIVDGFAASGIDEWPWQVSHLLSQVRYVIHYLYQVIYLPTYSTFQTLTSFQYISDILL